MTRRHGRAVGGFLRDFREFALKGNVIDLAVGVIIGAAFSKIIDSLVVDVITPLLGAIFGVPGEAFKTLTLGPVNLGLFINAVLNFLIIAFSLYLIIKWAASFNRQEAAAEPLGPDLAEVNLKLTEAVDRLNSTMQSK
jgi:large conductance mechanosensitive channel